MFCPKCGAKNEDTARFCKNCGQPLMKAARPRKAPCLIGVLVLAAVCVIAGVVIYPRLRPATGKLPYMLVTTATPSLPTMMTPFIPQPTPFTEIPLVITTTAPADSVTVIEYRFEHSGRFIGQMADESQMLLLVGTTNDLWLFNRHTFERHPLASGVKLPIAISPQTKRVFYATELESGLHEVWSVKSDGSDNARVGTTVGNFPRFSVSADGQVLLLENGHLVLKSADGQILRDLSDVEKRLGLRWGQYGRLTDSDTFCINFSISPNARMAALFVDDKLRVIWLDDLRVTEIPIDVVPFRGYRRT